MSNHAPPLPISEDRASTHPSSGLAALPHDATPLDGARIHVLSAELAWLRGDDAAAETLLLSARRSAESAEQPDQQAWVQLAFARYALAVDQEELAVQLLTDISALTSIDRTTSLWAGLILARLTGAHGVPPDPLGREFSDIGDPVLRCAVLVERACLARKHADRVTAHAAIALAEQVGVDGPTRLALLSETAESRLAVADHLGADDAFRQAMELASEAGWHRAQGRLALRYGVSIAAIHDARGGPMQWIGRAATELEACATWRDKKALRDALRVHGRRIADRVVSEDLAVRLSSFERAAGASRLDVFAGADRIVRELAGAVRSRAADPSSVDTAADALGSMLASSRELASTVARSSDELTQMLASAVVERDRMGQLLLALSDLEPMVDVAAFAAQGARIAARLLDADGVVVAALDPQGPRPLGCYPLDRAQTAPSWRAAITQHVEPPPTLRSASSRPVPRDETGPVGPTLVTAIAAPPFRGAICADKLARGAQFRESDRLLLALLGGYLALGLARLQSRQAEHTALVQLGTTLDTIRDGVVALDDDGVVLRANAAALRMLRVAESQLVGTRLSDRPELASLASVISKQRADAEMVALPQGRIVVTVRPMNSHAEQIGPRGLVATFVALDRAREMAYRVTGVRPRYSFDNIVCASPQLAQVVEVARVAAMADAGVLITGESGTGKEVIAQAIHTGGRRAQAPFVGINCAALPRELLEAELFGYERGAFTGARSEGHPGKFEQAGEGTILLDEIGDMPLEMQAKLLRVLQERSIVRIGGSREIPVRARVIATTHRNLEQAVARQTFRLDLLYRLRVLHIHIPPLRERQEDIPALAIHILRRVAEAQDKRVTDLSPDVLRALASHTWPGNVRELANVIETEVTLLKPEALALENLRTTLGAGWGAEPSSFEPVTSVRFGPMPDSGAPAGLSREVVTMAETQKRAYLAALEAHGGKVSEAANALGVSRAHLYAKLKEWGVKARRGRE